MGGMEKKVNEGGDICIPMDVPGGSDGKVSAYSEETRVQSLGWEDLLEKEMAIHSSILVWKTPWTEEPGRLQSMRSQRVRHDRATSLSFSPSCLIQVVVWQKPIQHCKAIIFQLKIKKHFMTGLS